MATTEQPTRRATARRAPPDDRGAHRRRPCRPQGRPAQLAPRLGARRESPRPRRDARGAGRDARPRAGAGPLRPDARLAVHLLPRCRIPDGGRPRPDPAHRARRAALRRRAPLQLRRLRGAGPAARVQHQRLRRDPSGTVRLGREAACRELRRGGPRPRLQRRPARRDQPRGGAVLPRGDARVRRHAHARHLVRAARRRRDLRPLPRGCEPQGAHALRGQPRQDAQQGQRQGDGQAHRDDRRTACGSSAIRPLITPIEDLAGARRQASWRARSCATTAAP